MHSDRSPGLIWQGVYYTLVLIIGAMSFRLAGTLPVGGEMFVTTSLVIVGLFIGRAGVWLAETRPESPIAAIQERWRPALQWGFARYALFQTSTFFFLWLPPIKSAIPDEAGYWADIPLMQFERAILGRDPWEILHLLPNGVTPVIDFIYASWIILIVLVSLIIAVFGSAGLIARYFLSWAMAWIFLGVLVAYALPSAGPIFGPDIGFGFHGLHQQIDGTIAMRFHDMLWDMQTTKSADLGGGISAMPSMHCALTSIFVAASWRSRLRVPVLAYAMTIWFGSIYLGWHYALDGLVSMAGVALIWRAASAIAEMRLSGTLQFRPSAASA